MKAFIPIVAFLVLGLGVAVWFLLGFSSAPLTTLTPATPLPTPPVQVIPASPLPESPKLEQTPTAPVDPLDQALTQLRRSATAANVSNVLHRLSGMKAGEASGIIQNLLKENIDGPTGQAFKVGADGSLTHAPTLRTALLNKLTQLDPQAAAGLAREILNSMESPDEWALSLRAVALGDTSPAGQTYLKDKTRQMLTHQAWQEGPSVGFLEAFDVVVHNADTEFVPELTSMVNQKENQAIAHAAYLTVDRLVIRQTDTVLAQLLENPELMTGRLETRANYFARADLRNAEERNLVESYLLNPDLAPDELSTFAGIFPNANYMISHNLLTKPITPDGATLRERDRAALQVLDQWLQDSRFAPIKPSIEKARTRLAGFVK